jgi:hypothetical protein
MLLDAAQARRAMKAIEFEGYNVLLGPPPGTPRGECGALPVIRYATGAMSSFWKPTPEDLVMLNNGAHVRLDVFSAIHPPVALSVERAKELP